MNWTNDPRLPRADALAQRGEVLQAELLYRGLLKDHADCVPAARAVAALAIERGDLDSARLQLEAAVHHAPGDTALLFQHAQVLWQLGRNKEGLAGMHALLALDASDPVTWLVLGNMHDAAGDSNAALRAWYQAVTRAQKAGMWMNRDTTDPAIVDLVMHRIEKLRAGRRQYLFDAIQGVRDRHGSAALARMDRALTGYLGEWDTTPPDPRQRPKFFYFPGLPEGPYHDPWLQPWAGRLHSAWQDIRGEAMGLLAEDRDFESFLGLQPGQNAAGYVGGSNPNASWDAFFFYRRGQRFDANHSRCPITSEVLDSVELCHVANQAPEVCYSVIRPQSTIMAHHGVTNTRLVMHLPLIVPPDCALNVVDAGQHHWKEGELMMFDDTYQHEAWNRSNEPRLIVLMDCWNPHLTEPEQQAVKQLVEAIDTFENGVPAAAPPAC